MKRQLMDSTMCVFCLQVFVGLLGLPAQGALSAQNTPPIE